MRALVIGASGAVGTSIAELLENAGHAVTRAARRRHPHSVTVDLRRDVHGFAQLAPHHDVIINASGVENPAIALHLGGATLVDISATGSYLAALRCAADSARASVVLGAGLAPGLSTALIGELGAKPGDEIDVGIMLGSGEKHGAAAVAWTKSLAGSEIASRPETEAIRNFRERRTLLGGDGKRRRYLRADFPDHTLLGPAGGYAVRSYLALSSRHLTQALAVVGAIPQLSSVISAAPALGDDSWALAAVNRRTGERRSACGRNQSRATAELTALLAERSAVSGMHGCVTAHDLATSGELAAALSTRS
ncbi:NAD-dependent epimerase/dehydratase family protein [Pseudoclavibacter sp. 8L]|uniref:NAD-dependent epimerase/dehydratase family protein n=1 Tax=Pseudoclavibacter sp. 8L TaxID=2653162 RepID=UPI0012EEFB7D|nr:NAD-dependent epimerase/dehydratase family protein [Pseudoclavibacter sp. 8L]VXB02170.1 Saccharopine dehydrogenase [Pseudoclavibacter sp. 8L]